MKKTLERKLDLSSQHSAWHHYYGTTGCVVFNGGEGRYNFRNVFSASIKPLYALHSQFNMSGSLFSKYMYTYLKFFLKKL